MPDHRPNSGSAAAAGSTAGNDTQAITLVSLARGGGPLRVLHLEDNAQDAELVHAVLARDGGSYRFVTAQTKAEFLSALAGETFDLILSDYALPDFDGITALRLVRDQHPNLPFILVSGTLGEEQAVECLKSGATDYILKTRLLRLPTAVRRAMRDAEARWQRRRTREELRAREESFRALTTNSPDAIARLDRELRFVYCNPAFERATQTTAAELIGKTWVEAGRPAQPEWEAGLRRTLATGAEVCIDFSQTTTAGLRYLEARLVPEHGADGQVQFVLAVTRDVTRIRAATEELRRETALLEALVDSSLDGILVVNNRGQKIAQNEQFNRLLKIPPHLAALQSDCERLEFVTNATKFPQQFRERVAYLYAHPDETSMDEIEFKDGLVLDRYTAPVRGKDGTHYGRIWMFRDITERKQTEAKLAALNKELIASSHQAGMAEVATGVLHNVGNVLNSVNVSATLIADRIKKSRCASLARVSELMEKNSARLGEFFTADAQGKQLPGFIAQLAAHLAQEQAGLMAELEQLKKNIGHIKEIVAMQQGLAKFSGVTERLQIADLVEDALRINASSLSRPDLAIIKDFAATPLVSVNKHKVLQILVNLIRNAKRACDDSGRDDKQMTLRIMSAPATVQVSVSDNGVGISSEHLARVFQHGFTTKKDGHGFGLHSGVLAAREMGGALRVQSDGPGRGATFTLELPGAPPVATEPAPSL
jgi:PAS domain S-box-containing protein